MQFIEPSITPIETAHNSTPAEMIKVIEQAYRICYKSESHMKEGSEELIHRLLHCGEKGKIIHTSPLEHRRIRLSLTYWLHDVIDTWQYNRGTSFITLFPQKNPSSDGIHNFVAAGNFRAFFDFIKDFKCEDNDYGDLASDHARIAVNNELHKYFPLIFDYMEPLDDNGDWGGCSYLGEDTDYMTFKITTSRDMLQEIARHRSMSPNVESTRYCNYSKRGMSICCPLPYEWAVDLVGENCCGFDLDGPGSKVIVFDTPKDIKGLYRLAASLSELFYNKAIEYGAKPQEARGLLLGCLKTEIMLTGTIESWSHFIRLRNDSAADPQIRYLASKIEDWFYQNDVSDIREFDLF